MRNEERQARWIGASMHASFLLTMMMVSGWTWAKLLISAVWLAMAFFEQRRGSSLGEHWTAPAVGGVWLVLSILVMCSRATPAAFAGWAGAGLVGFGAFLRVQALVALGAGYSDGVRPVRPRVQDGVYTYFDHPGELGALALALGASVGVGSLAALTWTLVALLPLTLYRFYLEERFLGAGFARGSAAMRSPFKSSPFT